MSTKLIEKVKLRPLFYGLIIITMIFISILSVSAQTNNTTQTSTKTLKDAGKKNNILIGAAVQAKYLDEKKYTNTLKEDFNLVVPENALLWDAIHPAKNKYDFSYGDKIVNFAKMNNMTVRGGFFVWHYDNPDWLVSIPDGDEENAVSKYSKNELEKILQNHINNVAGHYKGKIKYWDVANEVMDDSSQSGKLRETFWKKTLGESYISKAFSWAHAADPNAKLFINDYGIVEKNPKSTALYNLVKKLKANGTPIDGIGIQLHIESDTKLDQKSIAENLKRFRDLGLEIQFTEVDVAIRGKVTDAKLKQQSDMYAQLISIAKEQKVTAFLTWGVTDKYSWLQSWAKQRGISGTFGSGLLFDEKYKEKPAYTSVLNTLNAK